MVAGVVGWPVAHSLSPLIHNAWIEALGLDAVYVPFAVPEERFEAFVNGLRGGIVRGVNVTLPFKTRAKRMSEYATCEADFADAANVLVLKSDGKIDARNYDGEGLQVALEACDPEWSTDLGPIAIVGAGGAASAALAALIEAGAREIRVLNRSKANADALAERFRPEVKSFGFDEAEAALGGVTAVINASSAELKGTGRLPPLLGAPTGAIYMDMIYTPLRTPFLQAAAARGHRTADGLAMLVGQARPSFEAFFGVPAPGPEVVDVRALCLQALGEAA